ncbi:MAG: formylglycine-generating enzyme family protein [Elainellaceae cyanobacterium]
MSNLIIRRENKQIQAFTEDLGNNVGMDMVLIPGGTFQMGSPDDEPERHEREGPQHSVTVPTFLMGQCPVTQEQWGAIASLPKINRELKPDPSRFKGGDRPVEQVNWYDAVEFCNRLSRKTNRTYRLPSEAEWEYACRAETITPFHFGETITTDIANYDGDYTYGRGSKGTYREETTLVKHFGVTNAFGLYDMHGNVWEWCLDHWHNNYKNAPTDGSAWLTDEESTSRVIRGGSWGDVPRDCRSAYRDVYNPVNTYLIVGFRVVCAVPRSS